MFGKREIINFYDYQTIKKLDNLNKISDYNKKHIMYNSLLKEYKRRIQLAMKKKKYRSIFKKIIGKSFTKRSLNTLPVKKIEELYFILMGV